MLFRLLRGAGLQGLAGILPSTEAGLIRPLLGITRAEVEEFLRARGLEWREDSSNRDEKCARNRIRHGLLPRLERDWNPEMRASLARMADLAGEEERWWQARIARLFQSLLAKNSAAECDGGVEIRADVLAGLPKAVSRRLFRHVARRAGGNPPEFEHVERALRLACGERVYILELPGMLVVRSFDWLSNTCN